MCKFCYNTYDNREKGGTFMAKKGENRGPVTMKCSVCGNIIRPTEKNKKNTVDKLSLSKYCPKCRQHTEHNEKKN